MVKLGEAGEIILFLCKLPKNRKKMKRSLIHFAKILKLCKDSIKE